jgi:prevent-host-death family protein
MKAIEIPVRELHARTGHYVRKAAANQRIIITDRGRRVAELHPLGRVADDGKRPAWRERQREPDFAAVVEEPVGGTDSTRAVSGDRDR